MGIYGVHTQVLGPSPWPEIGQEILGSLSECVPFKYVPICQIGCLEHPQPYSGVQVVGKEAQRPTASRLWKLHLFTIPCGQSRRREEGRGWKEE